MKTLKQKPLHLPKCKYDIINSIERKIHDRELIECIAANAINRAFENEKAENNETL